jgi:hypothetical protein
MSDDMLTLAFPLIREALDGFASFDRLRIGYTDFSVLVMTDGREDWKAVLDAAFERLDPVFLREGWTFRARVTRGVRDQLKFYPPEFPPPRPNLRVVR